MSDADFLYKGLSVSLQVLTLLSLFTMVWKNLRGSEKPSFPSDFPAFKDQLDELRKDVKTLRESKDGIDRSDFHAHLTANKLDHEQLFQRIREVERNTHQRIDKIIERIDQLPDKIVSMLKTTGLI